MAHTGGGIDWPVGADAMAVADGHAGSGDGIVEAPPEIDFRNLIWVAMVVAALVGAILARERWLLNFVHVMTGVLWTGIDLFMGFVVGPIMRRMDSTSRRALIVRLVPRMLFLMPTLSITTGTSGWFLAEQLGYFDVAAPGLYWVTAAVAILVVLTVQGLGFLLPTNIRVYLELRKEQPDSARITKLMRRYIYVVASQGVLQVAMIVIMARFVAGL
jgi:uncharacterized membrane protein